MSTGNRVTIYLSQTKDQDILSFIEPLVNHYNRSTIFKELIRDGIKLRNKITTRPNVIQSNTLGHIEIKKKEITQSEIEERLDNF